MLRIDERCVLNSAALIITLVSVSLKCKLRICYYRKQLWRHETGHRTECEFLKDSRDKHEQVERMPQIESELELINGWNCTT
mmetsp:Transcript_11263/g.20359  ORF Transcript_11263/g.20359 Transcript_11263/m.20359 type:complete len:82 (+) Transcript_11263:345-590(+)